MATTPPVPPDPSQWRPPRDFEKAWKTRPPPLPPDPETVEKRARFKQLPLEEKLVQFKQLTTLEEKYEHLKQLKTFQEGLAHFKLITFPENEKWARIFEALCYVYAVSAVVLYALGMYNVWATRVVYYLWKANLFGITWGVVPYTCAHQSVSRGDDICQRTNYWNDFLDLKGTPYLHEFHYSFFFFILGGLVSIRIIVFCWSKAEAAFDVDFLSRVIDKFLPGKPKG